MATITIDNRKYQVDGGNNLLHECLSLGLDLPYFCWHPAMGSVGACRQCAVKQYQDEDDDKGKIIMACMMPAADGTRIAIDDPEARDFRASVIEWLMINHPHDCPVCEEGGECHLQDMTQMSGHVYRRHRFAKRTHRNQYLGPFIGHEMNRCIACYRCVRFYNDYAGGRDLEALGPHDHVYFGRHEDGTLESEFSGNLAEVCPTGVFVDKPMSQRYTRKWDLRSSPSVCAQCGVGCNISPNERYGILKRVLNRYNDAVNGYFICDRGRFGHDYVNGERRIFQPWLRDTREADSRPVTRQRALDWLRGALADGRAVGIGSPRASIETNFALRALVGAEHFHSGLAQTDHDLARLASRILRAGTARTPTLRDTEAADAVLVLGEDLNNSAPRIALALRQAVRQQSLRRADKLGLPRWHDNGVREATPPGLLSPLFIASPAPTRLDDVARETTHGTPEVIARLGFAVAHALDDAAPAVRDLDDDTGALAGRIAAALRGADRPLVVSGGGCRSVAVMQAAANIAWALRRRDREDAEPAALTLALPEGNSFGIGLLADQSLDAAFERLESGDADTMIVAENDLYRRAPAGRVDAALAAARRVIVIDHIFNPTAGKADLILPAATFAECDGTLVSHEGRAQRFFAALEPEPNNEVMASWRWFSVLARNAGQAGRVPWTRLDPLIAACAGNVPALGRIGEAAVGADFRINGRRIAREPHRYSGRTAMHAHRGVHEPPPPEDPDTPFSFTMEGHQGEAPPGVIPFFWAPGWNSEQSVNKFQAEIDGPLHGGDSGVRLVEPHAHARDMAYFDVAPETAALQDGGLRAVPLYEVFGSDELSALSPAVAERVPQPYVALNPADAEALGLAEGDPAPVHFDDRERTLAVRHQPGLARGTVGIPLGLPGLAGLVVPGRVRIEAR